MIYVCSACRRYTFYEKCQQCDGDWQQHAPVTSPGQTSCVPLHPRFYPDFRYASKGFFKDLLHKRKEVAHLHEVMEGVLSKYERFRAPYFVNFLHIMRARSLRESAGDRDDPAYRERLHLFKLVLQQLGFEELGTLEDLTERLLLTTEFSFEYAAFSLEIESHVQQDLRGSLSHWIEERGAAFRRELPLFLYHAWENHVFCDEIAFGQANDTGEFTPLVSRETLATIEQLCEDLYLRVKIERFRSLLENFDPAKYMTIYKVDAMSGHDFEHLLARLFASAGFEVEETRQTQDQGADLLLQRFGRRIVVQAKRYSENVGNAAVQQVIAAMQHFSCDGAMVVTNSHYTPSAKELAESVGVTLIDRDRLRDMLEDYNQMLIEGANSSSESNAMS